MAEVHQLSRRDARRIAVRAQLLTRDRPTDLVETVRQLSLLQIEPTSAVAPSAELVLWSRFGSSFRPHELWDAVDEQRLIEVHQSLRAPEDIALFRAEMDHRRESDELTGWLLSANEWVHANNECRRDILERLRDSGPLTSRDIPDTCTVPWASTGWTHNRNVTQMLEYLMLRGEVAISGRVGRERVWDLPERVYPAGTVIPSVEEARRIRNERRLRALGIARAKTTGMPVEPIDVGDAGEPAVVEGTTGEWRVDPAALGGNFEGRTALLSPFDRLIHDRARAQAIFDFEYILEMYKPAAKRRFGYFALPILHGDRLVGKLDAAADRKAGVLRVNAIHEDVRFTKPIAKAVRAEIEDLVGWLGLEVGAPPPANARR